MPRVEELSFSELVHELMHEEQSDEAPDLERAIRRRRMDARLIHLMSLDGIIDERRAAVRVTRQVPVALHTNHGARDGELVDLGESGARLHVDGTAALAVGEPVDLLLDHGPGHAARATAQVQWCKPRADEKGFELAVHFLAEPDVHRRRMRRLVLEILRFLPDPVH